MWLDIGWLLPLTDEKTDARSGCPRYKFGVLHNRRVRLRSLHPPGVVTQCVQFVHVCNFGRSGGCTIDKHAASNSARRLTVVHNTDRNEYLLNVYAERVFGSFTE